MLIDSVRSLKKTLIHRRGSHFRLRSSVLNKARLSKAAYTKFADTLPMAMGVAHHRGEHKLAIRIHHTHVEIEKLVALIHREACGEVDIQVIGRVRALGGPPIPKGRKTRRRPIGIGDSIGLVGMKAGAGTVGCFVKSSTDDHLILSNNHVLAEENTAKPGSPIVQPGPADGGEAKSDRIGSLLRFVKLNKNGNRVDAALAAIDEGIEYYPTDLGALGRLNGVRKTKLKREPVAKIGRTTGLTRGKISAFEIDGLRVMFPYPALTTTFDQQLEIAPGKTGAAFSEGGDSGSLVVDGQNRAVGLLFASNDTKVRSFVNPIQFVLDALKVKLAT